VITTGGELRARYVIHTVSPVWHGGAGREAELLESAYYESLKLAAENRLASISFPAISTGAYGHPVDQAARIAVDVIISFLRQEATTIKEVVFVLFDSRTYQSYVSALQEAMGRSNADGRQG
jgi:O-acetyl-ADP-ribose deacetylase